VRDVSEETAVGRGHRLEPLVLVALGGFGGAVCRYLVGLAAPVSFPWGTVAVNVLGSFLLGLLLYESRLVGSLSAETRLVVGTGFLSSFTTYSTFAVETSVLSPTLAALNVTANYGLGVLAVLAARLLARVVA
jgi:CrcB protein